MMKMTPSLFVVCVLVTFLALLLFGEAVQGLLDTSNSYQNLTESLEGR